VKVYAWRHTIVSEEFKLRRRKICAAQNREVLRKIVGTDPLEQLVETDDPIEVVVALAQPGIVMVVPDLTVDRSRSEFSVYEDTYLTLAHARGDTWKQIADTLGRSTPTACYQRWRRMRRDDLWEHDPEAIREAPTGTGPGRPRNRAPSRAVSVDSLLRELVEQLHQKPGKIVNEAIRRAVGEEPAIELPNMRRRAATTTPRDQQRSVEVDAGLYDQIVALDKSDEPAATKIVNAVHEMLRSSGVRLS
jgi:hypothetical protein